MTVDALRKATPELAVEGKHLQLPLMAAERAWAYAMQLKFEMNSEPRKKYHMQNRLRKAKSHAEQLVQLVMAEGAPVSLKGYEGKAWPKGAFNVHVHIHAYFYLNNRYSYRFDCVSFRLMPEPN